MLHAARQASKRLSSCNVRQRWRRLQPDTRVTFMVRMSILGQTAFWLNGFRLSLFPSRMRQLCWFFCPLPASKISPPRPRSCEVRHNVTCLQWTSSPKLRSSRPRGSVEAPPPHERGPPSSNRGRPASLRASRRRRESRGEFWVSERSLHSRRPQWWFLFVSLIVCVPTGRFGDDIPGMEGLGTGEFTSGFFMCFLSN